MSVDKVKKRILIVDDEANILDAIKRQLRRQYDITTCLSGQEALEIIADSDPFGVVISDYRMVGMDGLAFLREVRKISPDSVCMMLTGHADFDIAIEAVNEGLIFRFLKKPCEQDVLREAINDAYNLHARFVTVGSFTYTAFVDDGKLQWTNHSKGFSAVTGYSARELAKDQQLWTSIVLPEHQPMVRQTIRRVTEGNEVPAIEFKIKRRDGVIRWVHDTIIPQRDEKGHVYRYDGLVEDITSRKQIEQELEKSESRYERMVANVPGMVFQAVLKKDGSIEFPFVSDSCKGLLDVSARDIMSDGNNLIGVFHAEGRGEFYSQLLRSAENLTPCSWSGRAIINGHEKWFQSLSRPERLKTGEIIWDGLLLDITERKKIENEVRMLARFTDENPNPVMRVLLDGTITYSNAAGQPLLKLWKRQIQDKLPGDILEYVKKINASGTYDCVEVHCEGRYFAIVVAPADDAEYINLYARDITAAKLAEMELIKANEILTEHDRLKSEFVSTVSHELRTPLCIFKNILSNALAGAMGKFSSKLRQSLQMADTSVDRLSRIISDFLDISKIESGKMDLKREVIDIKPVVSSVAESLGVLATAKDIELNVEMPVNDIIVNADRDRIVQVMTNIIGNAIKFIQTNGNINVCVSDMGSEIEIAISDDGPGMTREDLKKIFDRFVQAKTMAGPGEHGTGLGLTIARELVEMHDGRIWVDSKKGQGSCFHIILPKYSKNSEATQKADAVIEQQING